MEGAGSGQSILAFGTAMNVDLSKIVSSCGGGFASKGIVNISEHVGHALITSSEEVIRLLKISFKVPDALAQHINSVPFQQFFPLRRRFLSRLLIEWDRVFLLNWRKKVTVDQLAAGTKIAVQDAIDSLVKGAESFMQVQSQHRCALAQLEFRSYNSKDNFVLDSIEQQPLTELQDSLLTSGLCSYSCSEEGSRDSKMVQFETTEFVTRGVLRKLKGSEKDEIQNLELLLKQTYARAQSMKPQDFDTVFGFFLRYHSLNSGSISEWKFLQTLPGAFPPSIAGFVSSKERGLLHGVLSGRNGLIILLAEAYERESEERQEKIELLVSYLRLERTAKSICPEFALSNPHKSLDGALFYLVNQGLEELICGYIFTLSRHIHADGVALVKLNDNPNRFKRYGWIFFAHKLLETQLQDGTNKQTKANVGQADPYHFFLQLGTCSKVHARRNPPRKTRQDGKSVFPKEPQKAKTAADFRNLILRFPNRLPIAATMGRIEASFSKEKLAELQTVAILIDRATVEKLCPVQVQRRRSSEAAPMKSPPTPPKAPSILSKRKQIKRPTISAKKVKR